MASPAINVASAADPEVATEVNPGLAGRADSTSLSGAAASGAVPASATRLEHSIEQWRLPVLGSMPVERQIQALSMILVACLLVAAGIVYQYTRAATATDGITFTATSPAAGAFFMIDI